MKGYHRFVSEKLVIKVADSRVLSRSLFMSLTNYQTAFCFFSEVYYEAFTNICIISLFFYMCYLGGFCMLVCYQSLSLNNSFLANERLNIFLLYARHFLSFQLVGFPLVWFPTIMFKPFEYIRHLVLV